MNKAPNPTPWYQPWRAGRRKTDADAADLGTAFGLDMSLDPWEHSTSADADLPADAPAHAPTPAPARQPGWLTRWATGREPTL